MVYKEKWGANAVLEGQLAAQRSCPEPVGGGISGEEAHLVAFFLREKLRFIEIGALAEGLLQQTVHYGKDSRGQFRAVFQNEQSCAGDHGAQAGGTGWERAVWAWNARRMGVNFEFKPIDWRKKREEITSGNVDILWNGTDITEERKEYMIFTKPFNKAYESQIHSLNIR